MKMQEQRPTRTEARPERKLIVAIPTRDRPAYLHWTVKSVLEQARDHGHDNVEIVISDVSSNRRNAGLNQRLMASLQRRFPKTPIRYYGPTTPEPIARLEGEANGAERRALRELTATKGHWGAHRNRLTLLAVYHGGSDAAYLHLDDDTPIAVVEKTENNVKTPRNPRDVLGLFQTQFEHARKLGLPGYSGAIAGVEDAAVSIGRRIDAKLKETLMHRRAQKIPEGHLLGPGRILEYEAMNVPYRSYGINEDTRHAQMVLVKWAATRNPAIKKAYSFEGAESAPHLLHVGIKGTIGGDKFIDLADRHRRQSEQIIRSNLAGWSTLVDKMSRLTKQPTIRRPTTLQRLLELVRRK